MLTAHHLSKSFDHQPLFENISFSLSPGERMGLVGPNGCGKTTLLRILAGEEQADGGHVSRPADMRIGYLPQGLALDPTETLGEVIGRLAGAPGNLEAELAAAAQSLAARPGDVALQSTYDDILRRMQMAESGRAAAILGGLGLAEIAPGLPLGQLSGGQQTRLALALVLLG